MRVLILSHWFPPILSGSSFYTSSLSRALAAHGHEVVVVTLDWGVEHSTPADVPFPLYRLPVIQMPRLPVFYNMRNMGFGFTPGNIRRLRLIIHQHRPQILHHVNHIFDTVFLSTYVGHSCGVPVVGSITTPIQHQNPMYSRVMSLADRMTVGWCGVRRWDGIVCLDRVTYEYVGSQYGPRAQQRSAIIPFGPRLESMSSYDKTSALRSEQPQVLFVGHIHPFRNPVQLVRAMPRILEVLPRARLILAGRVDLQEPVQVARSLGLSADQVQFLGETRHEDVVRLIKTSHIFVSWVTGPYPGLGTAPMEAMLCETPVVNDLPENLFGEGKLKKDENIILVDSLDPQSIADALIRVLKDEKRRRRIGAAGRRFILEHLSWDSIAFQMEHFYARVLQKWNSRAAGKTSLDLANQVR